MSKERYKKNRARVFEIMGVDPSDPNYSCHHEVIYKRDAKRNPRLRKDLDKIDNLFPLANKEHERLHLLEDGVTGYTPPSGRRKSKRKRLKFKRRRRR